MTKTKSPAGKVQMETRIVREWLNMPDQREMRDDMMRVARLMLQEERLSDGWVHRASVAATTRLGAWLFNRITVRFPWSQAARLLYGDLAAGLLSCTVRERVDWYYVAREYVIRAEKEVE